MGYEAVGSSSGSEVVGVNKIGDLDKLNTADKNTLVSAINEVNTTAQTADNNVDSAVNAANTAESDANTALTVANNNKDSIGTLQDLNTDVISDLVNAVNEVDAHADTAQSTADSATTTANQASTNASTALANSNSAVSDAQTALDTANTASNTASANQTELTDARTNNRGKTFSALNDRLNSIDVDLKERAINVMWYSVEGDSVTDDTVEMQNALNDGANKTVFVPDNMLILISSPVKLQNGTSLVMGKNSKFIASNSFNGTALIQNEGYAFIKQAIAPSSAVTAGANTVTLSDVTSIGEGMLFRITNNAPDTLGYSDGELALVVDTNPVNNTITLDHNFKFSYDTTAVIDVIQMAENVRLQNVSIDTTDASKNLNGFELSYIKNVSVINPKGLTGGKDGLRFTHCYHGLAYTGYFENFLDLNATDRTGYGVLAKGVDITVENIHFTNCKHAATSADRDYYSRDIQFINNYAHTFTDPDAHAFDLHKNVIGGCIERNTIENATNGIQVRAKGTIVKTNNLREVGNAFTIREYGTANVSFEDNKIEGYTVALDIDYVSDNLDGVKVHRNDFQNQSGATTIIPVCRQQAHDGDRLFIENNEFNGLDPNVFLLDTLGIGGIEFNKNRISTSNNITRLCRFNPQGYNKKLYRVDDNVINGTTYDILVEAYDSPTTGSSIDVIYINDNFFSVTANGTQKFAGITEGTIYVNTKQVTGNWFKP